MPSGMVGVQYGLGGPNLSHAIGESAAAIARGAADVALAVVEGYAPRPTGST